MAGTKKLMPAEEMTAFMQDFMQKQNEKKQSAAILQAKENKKKGLDFLTKNKSNRKVKTTSGLQYEVLQEGDGKTKPKASDVVQVN